jgi:hypothetical protein
MTPVYPIPLQERAIAKASKDLSAEKLRASLKYFSFSGIHGLVRPDPLPLRWELEVGAVTFQMMQAMDQVCELISAIDLHFEHSLIRAQVLALH